MILPLPRVAISWQAPTRTGYHLRNVNFGRDFQAQVVGDVLAAESGDECPLCAGGLQEQRGVVVGSLERAEPSREQRNWPHYADDQGHMQPLSSVRLCIDATSVMGTLAAQTADDKGLCWRRECSPLDVHIVRLDGGEEAAEELFVELRTLGLEVLLDDRDVSAGVKFKDADLIGLPVRITLSRRSLEQGGAEVAWRRGGLPAIVPLASLPEAILQGPDES